MFVPSLFIIVCNIMIIVKLRQHLKNIPASAVSFNCNDIVYESGNTQTIKYSKAGLSRLNSRLSTGRNNSSKAALKRKSLRYADLELSRSLIIMTSFFISLNLPNYLLRIAFQFQLNLKVGFWRNLNIMMRKITESICLYQKSIRDLKTHFI
jgi:hypothetical protein